jgi:hypothetical protein
MSKKRYTYHPACLAFPLLPEPELKALAEDIKLRGLLNPIVMFQGKVLDGRNRLAACEIAEVEPRFVEWEGDSSPTEWVIATNLFRRQLTASQRAVVALDLLPVLDREAKERQRLSQGRGKKGGKVLPTNSSKGKASQIAARLTKTNRQYVQTLKKIQRTAPELIEKVRVGELTVPDAKAQAGLSRAEREQVLKGERKLDKPAKRVHGRAEKQGTQTGGRGSGAEADPLEQADEEIRALQAALRTETPLARATAIRNALELLLDDLIGDDCDEVGELERTLAQIAGLVEAAKGVAHEQATAV